MKRGKKFLLVQILEAIKQGKNPSQISKDLNISKQNLNYYVGKLKKVNSIRKVGYGVWEYVKPYKEVKNLTTTHSDRSKKKVFTSKQIRGHAFIWKIEFYRPIEWEEKLKNSTLTYQKISSYQVCRIIFRNRKVWLTKKGLIIYEPLDYFGKSSFQVKGTAVYEMDSLVKALLKRLKIKPKPYKFTTSREHYGIIKNELARQYNDKKEKLSIKSEDGGIWLWIDDSLRLGELENNEPVISRKVQNWWNDHRKHNFEVTPSFTLEAIKGLTENAVYNDRNIIKHFEVLDKIGDKLDELGKAVKKLYGKR